MKKQPVDAWPDWIRVFTSPEDPTWHLVKNSTDLYGLTHECPPSPHTPPDYHNRGRGCSYCGAEAPNELWGLFNLCDWKP